MSRTIKNIILLIFLTIICVSIGLLFLKIVSPNPQAKIESSTIQETGIEENLQNWKNKNSGNEVLNNKSIPKEASFQLLNHSLILNLVFDDPTLTDKEKFRITKDLNHLYEDLSIIIDEIDSQKYLTFEGIGRLTPTALQIPLKVHEENEQLLLDIPESVCEAYKIAFKFIEENHINEEEVATFLAKAETGNISADSLVVPLSLSNTREKLEELIPYFSRGKMKIPSPLSYRFEQFMGEKVILAETLYLELDGDKVTHSLEIVVFFDEGQWKIAF